MARRLISTSNTRAAEKKIRGAAAIRFGRGKMTPNFEHGQWFVSGYDYDGMWVHYSVVDARPGVGHTGIDFEEL